MVKSRLALHCRTHLIRPSNLKKEFFWLGFLVQSQRKVQLGMTDWHMDTTLPAQGGSPFLTGSGFIQSAV